MTPDELALIGEARDVIAERPDEFTRRFYDTLFELAPATRALFPADLSAQRGKLLDELRFLLDASRDLPAFTVRAHELGRRHVGYGVTDADYAPVGAALVASLRDLAGERWTDEHENAWAKLYRLIAEVMREGARDELFVDTR